MRRFLPTIAVLWCAVVSVIAYLTPFRPDGRGGHERLSEQISFAWLIFALPVVMAVISSIAISRGKRGAAWMAIIFTLGFALGAAGWFLAYVPGIALLALGAWLLLQAQRAPAPSEVAQPSAEGNTTAVP